MKTECRYKRPDGTKCKANATALSGLCFFHDPKRAADRLEAQRAGGLRNKAVSLPVNTPDCNLKNAADVIALLGTTINQVRRGQIEARIANTIGYLSATLLRAQELGNLEQRVSALEMVTSNQPQSSWLSDTEEFDFIERPPNDQQKATGAS
jgi:hypothetical protein